MKDRDVKEKPKGRLDGDKGKRAGGKEACHHHVECWCVRLPSGDQAHDVEWWE